MEDELAQLDATAQAELVREGEVSSLELVEAAIGRIEALNPELNAVITTIYDQARSEAQNIPPGGAFAGVPFLLKDLVAEMAGVPLAEGSKLLDGRFQPDRDSELVARYRKAGLVIVGKTNTPEYGLVPTTEPALSGATRNPWNRLKTPGGSSGGSAAAVAAGLVAMAHANDGGGSIRIPAACCGLVGMKPSRGRNPLGPAYGDLAGGIVAEHAVTRSVRDSARLLDATAGPMPGDPYALPAPARPFGEEVDSDPGRLRIAFTSRAMNGAATDPECVEAVEDAGQLAADLGHQVEEAELDLDPERMRRSFGTIWAGFCAWGIDYWCDRLGISADEADFEPATWAYYQTGKAIDAGRYLLAVTEAQELARQTAGFFGNIDVLLTPTLNCPPWDLGIATGDAGDAMAGMRRAARFVGFTPLFNITGQPAVSLPLYWSRDGLPIGVQFAGHMGAEGLLYSLAGQLERARPWAGRRPAIHAYS